MQVWLTKGMFGEKTDIISEETDNAKTALERIFMWKCDENNQAAYKIEKYDRLVFGKDGIAVDFGDYSWFMLITGKNADRIGSELSKGVD